MNIDKYKEEVSKEFIEAWDKSYGKAIYGEWGFQTCDLGSPFEVDKTVVHDYLMAKIDDLVKQIVTECVPEEKDVEFEVWTSDVMARRMGWNDCRRDIINKLNTNYGNN